MNYDPFEVDGIVYTPRETGNVVRPMFEVVYDHSCETMADEYYDYCMWEYTFFNMPRYPIKVMQSHELEQ